MRPASQKVLEGLGEGQGGPPESGALGSPQALLPTPGSSCGGSLPCPPTPTSFSVKMDRCGGETPAPTLSVPSRPQLGPLRALTPGVTTPTFLPAQHPMMPGRHPVSTQMLLSQVLTERRKPQSQTHHSVLFCPATARPALGHDLFALWIPRGLQQTSKGKRSPPLAGGAFGETPGLFTGQLGGAGQMRGQEGR